MKGFQLKRPSSGLMNNIRIGVCSFFREICYFFMFFMLAVFLIQYMLKARILIFLFGTEKYCIQRQVSPHKNKEVVFIRNTATSLDNSWL
jgi:hypothetical protein